MLRHSTWSILGSAREVAQPRSTDEGGRFGSPRIYSSSYATETSPQEPGLQPERVELAVPGAYEDPSIDHHRRPIYRAPDRRTARPELRAGYRIEGEELSVRPVSVVDHASSDGRRRDRREIRSHRHLPGEAELAVWLDLKGHHAVHKLVRIRVRRVANVEHMRRVRPRRNAVERPVADVRDLNPLGGACRD